MFFISKSHFARGLFLRNANFHENKTLAKIADYTVYNTNALYVLLRKRTGLGHLNSNDSNEINVLNC